jgi:hypothetical protein
MCLESHILDIAEPVCSAHSNVTSFSFVIVERDKYGKKQGAQCERWQYYLQ